ncbi:cytokine receptor-like [Pararge aegeria]|uniref:cytokine receptor-like n=1 Tax=Pararge aegeria TaxID=116150 RepID=UPI0019D0F042|nr:cytokine receptor-like [Pararge aegeria]
MADLLSRRTQCCGSRKRPQFQPWIWCILLKCLSLPCIFSDCLSVNITVAVYPQGDIYIKYGDPLEMFCVADSNYTTNDTVFTLGSRHLKSEVVNSTTRRLYIKRPEKHIGTYYCQNIRNNKICTSRVLVDSPPEKVTDFKCLSKNLEILNCSWTSPVSVSTIRYNVTFSINTNPVNPPCEPSQIESTGYCVWNTNSMPRYRQQEETQFFDMTACNAFGCNSQNFTVDHFSIVKPDSPYELKILKYGTHSVYLEWKIPHNIVDFLSCGVDHIIQYQIAKVDNRTYFHTVDTSHLPTRNKTNRFHLTDLPYAHMQYEVRIYIKSKKATETQFWSDYVYKVFTTASEIPNRPPAMIAGAFDQSSYKSYRVINVYWKQLEEWEEAGANFTYKVLVSQSNRTQIVFPVKNKSMSYVSLNATLDALDITVWSFNINGSSINSSQIYITPEKDTHSLKVTSFTKLAYENGTYELSWVGIKNIDNYTLFWCQHNATQICIGRLDFASLDSHKTSHIMDLPREYRYQFAISANNGSKSSGMSWAKCDISKEGFVMYRFEVHLKYDAPTKSSVTLQWQMDCALKDGIITGYNISYCPIVQTSSECDKSVESKYKFISNPKQMNVTIYNLYSFRTYQFTFALNTIHGQKNIENATVVITTSEDTPTSPRNVKISNVTYDSLVISWDPPQNRNGIIGKYVIWNYDKPIHEDKVSGTDTSKREITLTGLQAFTNYSLFVQACNIPIDLCSKRGQNTIFVRTSIGPPSMLKAPTVMNNPDKLKWNEPAIPGGTVDLYQIKRVIDDLEPPEYIDTKKPEYLMTHCEGVVSTETYQVRAVNYDYDIYNGVLGDPNVTLPKRALNDTYKVYPGPWSEPSTVACRSKDSVTMILIFLAVFALIGVAYGSIKLYKKYRKMEDIKPVLPNGLGIPEKDISKYTFSSWSPTTKDEKPPSDEMLLLPNSQTAVSAPDTKQKDDNCGASDQTDSTALSSDSSVRGPIDRQASISDDSSNSSFIDQADQVKGPEDLVNKEEEEEEDSSAIETESSTEDSPYFSDKAFKKNPTSGYVQPVVNPATGYVQSAPAPVNNPTTKVSMHPTTTSYVMAGLQPSVFTTSTATSPATNPPQQSSGYVLPEEAQARSIVDFPKLGPSPPKLLGPENLPSMPTLPPSTKHSTDNSYIQLQSLDSMSSLKPSVRNPVPLKPPASSGYVSPADVVINKHLNNIITGQHAEESAILDPAMSPDAYCRFSWSTDPANDNLHTLLADSPTRTTKN